MNKYLFIIICFSFLNCNKREQIIPDYNSLANQLIEQVLKDNSFNDCCMLEIPEKTFLEIREEMPLIAISTKKNHNGKT